MQYFSIMNLLSLAIISLLFASNSNATYIKCNVVLPKTKVPVNGDLSSKDFFYFQNQRIEHRIRKQDQLTIEATSPQHTLFPEDAIVALPRKGRIVLGQLILEPPQFVESNLMPARENRFLDSTALVESMLMEQITFLRRPYQRRLWSDEFSEKKATDLEALKANFTRSDRFVVKSELDKVVGSGSLIFSPDLTIRESNGGLSRVVPWTHFKEFLSNLKSEDTSSVYPENSLLPVEKFFQISFDRSQSSSEMILTLLNGRTFHISIGILVEIASFAIDHTYHDRSKVAEELYYEFLMATYERTYLLYKGHGHSLNHQIENTAFTSPFFFSYGDRVGQRMYRPFGFQKEESIKKNEYDVEWHPLFANETLLRQFGKSKNFHNVVERAYNQLIFNFIDPISEKSTMLLSNSSEMTHLIHLNQQRRIYFEESERQIRQLFLKYTRR